MIPVLAKNPIRYWLSILAGLAIRYWQGRRRAILAFDTGRKPIRYWLSILAGLAILLSACSPAWLPVPEPSPTAISSPTPAPAVEEKPAVPPAPGLIREKVSALQSLNVRKAATERSAALGVLYHGDPVTLTGKCIGVWAQIKYKLAGRVLLAWVNSRYITGDRCEVAE